MEDVRRTLCRMGLVALLIAAASAAWSEAERPAEGGSLFNFDRLGPGPAAGWGLSGEAFEWQAETTSGPFGPGAARISLAEGGKMVLASPAFRSEEEGAYALSLWVRAEPAGANVRCRLRDNNTNEGVGFEKEAQAGEQWEQLVCCGPVAGAVKGQYYLELAVSGGPCSLWLDGLWFGPHDGKLEASWQPPVHDAGVTLTPVASWGVSAGEEPLAVKACIVGVIRPGCELRLAATDADGAPHALAPVPLDASGLQEQEIAVTGEAAKRYGMVRVEGAVFDAEGHALSAKTETVLAHVPEPIPGPCPDSFFGVHVKLQEPDLAAVAKLGYKWCRIHDADGSTKWGNAEPEPGQWEWADEKMALVRKHGLCVLGMLDGCPPWASGSDQGGYFSIYHAPKEIEDWRNYVRRVVGHYKEAIHAWEVWNEPWDMMRFFQGGNPMLYTRLLKAAYEEAKAVDPACTIVGVDTYPPLWDAAVLAAGAYPYYDVLSWHRYDPCLHARPNDAIARVAKRLRDVQAKYGAPKPLMCSEGGPDVAMFHGSFLSYADPQIVGDWSRGADQYARWFLSAIAAGNERFIAYSVHDAPRHGRQNHMLIDPGPLVRPMHATLAALAHFVEGASYEKRLCPAHDISAHVFVQPNARPYASEPSTVVALIADGAGAEPLPEPIPGGVKCYDRWGNPCAAPKEATRATTYLVAEGTARDALLASLDDSKKGAEAPLDSVEALLAATAQSLASGNPPLWTLLSAQGAVAALGTPEGVKIANRGNLRKDSARAGSFRLPEGASIADSDVRPAGQFTVATARLECSANPAAGWVLTCAAVQDGPENGWRFTNLSIVPEEGDGQDDGEAEAVTSVASAWAGALKEGHTRDLHSQFYTGEDSWPCCVCASTLNGEYFVFDNPEHMVTMLDTAVVFGPAANSTLQFDTVAVSGGLAATLGKWNLVSLPFGVATYAFTATYALDEGAWRLVSFCASAG